MNARIALRFLSLGVMAGAVACSGDDPVLPPEIVSFSIDRDVVAAGETVTVSWSTTNADQITITQGSDNLVANSPMASGSQVSNPIDAPLVFSIRAVNSETGSVATDQVAIRGVSGIRIARFEANPATITESESANLEWEIGGEVPTSVIILDSTGAELYDQAEAIGSFTVSPDETETYRLRVRGPSGMVEEMTTLTVNQVTSPPNIISFTAVETEIPLSDRLQLRWEVEDTGEDDEFRILIDGVERRRWDGDTLVGNAQISVMSLGSYDATLEVRNNDVADDESAWARESITVNVLPIPVIDTLDVTPLEYTQASTVATITWATSETNSVNLRIDGADAPNFPRMMTAGSYQVDVSGEPVLVFIATNSVADTAETRRITYGFNEPEPNNTPAQAIPVPTDGTPVRGTVSMPGDEDWYVVMVGADTSLYAQVGVDPVTGCSFDTVLRLFDTDGITELGMNDDTNAPPIAPCSEINPLAQGYAFNLPAGTYYLQVSGNGAMPTGPYSLVVRALISPPPIAAAEATLRNVGTPVWEIGDFVQVSLDTGNMGDAVQPYIENVLAPMHAFAGFFSTSIVMAPGAPHRVNYDQELGQAFVMRGINPRRTTYMSVEIEAPNQLMSGFSIQPVSTTTTATTGQSADFLNGPIIPASVFPINVDLQIFQDGMMVFAADPHSIPAPGDFDPPLVGDGYSHWHYLSTVGAGAGAGITGELLWRYTLSDQQLNGYVFDIPFTLQ